jgi:2-hydroxychromene-2-carboxylate isomerase
MPFCLGVFRAAFGARADIQKAEVLGGIATEAGLAADIVTAAATHADNIARVHTHSLELIERGGFGTPSMFVNNTLFFGNDRVPLVEWTLGPMADDDFVLPGQHSQWK